MLTVSQSFWLHYVCFMLYLAVLTCDYAYMNLPTHRVYAGRFKYLTFWSFLIGLVYHNMAAIFDFMVYSREKDSPLWKSIRDYAFTTIVFPLAMFVCSMFWIIYTVNPTFLRKPDEEKLYPFWMNHGYHTLPILTVFVQAYLIKHTYPKNLSAVIGLVLVNSLYIAWLFWIAYRADIWVYPFLSRMSIFGVVLFIAASVALSFGLYFVGKKFSDFVWSNAKTKTS